MSSSSFNQDLSSDYENFGDTHKVKSIYLAQSSFSSVGLSFPNSSRHIVIVDGGTTKVYSALVQVNSDGTISSLELAKGAGISTVELVNGGTEGKEGYITSATMYIEFTGSATCGIMDFYYPDPLSLEELIAL